MQENRPGGNFITLYEAEKLMTNMLKDYEREVVGPRHDQTQGSIAEIKELVQQGTGMLKLGGVLISVTALVWIVMQIVHATGH